MKSVSSPHVGQGNVQGPGQPVKSADRTLDISVDGRWLATVRVPDRPKPPSPEWVGTTPTLPPEPTVRRSRRVELPTPPHNPAVPAGAQTARSV